ncbi:MAG: hypothetical protein O7G85_14385, partial [Planctomycetota bacterium]|nr:hypothetical protein [Planctomycetota bacterium]
LDDKIAPADFLDGLIEAGVNIGTFEPSVLKRRPIERFGARVYLFENQTQFRTAALVGSFDATTSSIERNLEAATLIESDDFTEGNDAGDYLITLLGWIDTLNFEPLTDTQRADHREHWGARQRIAKAAGANPNTIIEIKTPFISPLSWQELRCCEWDIYFRGLLDAEIQRSLESTRRLSGEHGWLAGIDEAQYAFREGPDRWTEGEIRPLLLGETEPSGCLGRCNQEKVKLLLETDPEFRFALHESIERCIVDPSRGTILHALSPLLGLDGVTVPILSRFLTIAAPDRYLSILEVDTALRLSDLVGFDVSGVGLEPEVHLSRYLDAIEHIQAFPWASMLSAERSTEHEDEADAWSKRVALLGCFVC